MKHNSGQGKRSSQLVTLSEVRIDKWLWAARFFKTRRLASEALLGGKIKLNGTRVKPSKLVVQQSTISITRDGHERTFIVLGLSDKRGPSSVARALYEETEESIKSTEAHIANIKLNPTFIQTEGRPTKRDRRLIHQFKQKNQ